jgi:ribosomal protein S18 acetylase RimI-like enzyme
LLAETLDAARQRGWRTLWLCAWQHNPRAIAFYRKHGFVQVGHTEVLVEDVVFHDFIMSRRLTTPDP